MKTAWKAAVTLLTGLVLAAGTALASCENAALPVVEGASWTYRDSSSATAYTQQISNVSATGFTMTQLVDGEAFEVVWKCAADGLLTSEFNLPLEGFQFETLEASGVTFPTRLAVGDTWESEFTIAGSMSQEGMQMSISGHSTSVQTVARRESVTVPAGTWDAFVVEGPFTMTMSASVMGMTMPIPALESSSTVWLVEGVGMVRNESEGSVMELIEFKIP